MSRQEIRQIPTTLWTRKAMYILLKFVTINRSLGCCSTSVPVRYFGRLITVSTRSLGLKMPSTAGWTWGMAFTGADSIIYRTLATLMPNRFSLIVNSMISISLVPDSNRILLLFCPVTLIPFAVLALRPKVFRPRRRVGSRRSTHCLFNLEGRPSINYQIRI